MDCGFDVAHTYEGWRYMLALGGAPSLLMFLGFLLVLPEVLGSTAVRRPCLSAGVHCPQQTPAADARSRPSPPRSPCRAPVGGAPVGGAGRSLTVP